MKLSNGFDFTARIREKGRLAGVVMKKGAAYFKYLYF